LPYLEIANIFLSRIAHLHELSLTLNCEKLHLLPKYERAPASPANADFLFSGP